jgi:hypothetical protein
MAGKQRYTVAEVIEALNDCNGLLYLAADKLGCTSETIINYKNRYPTIAEAVREKRGKRVDIAEASLDKAVKKGEAWAVQFLLRTQAKDRGYVERQELTGEDGAPIRFSLEQAIEALNKADHDRMPDSYRGNGAAH